MDCGPCSGITKREEIMNKKQNLASILNKYITIEYQEKISDEAGGHEIKWVFLATLPAAIQELGDYRSWQGEFYNSFQIISYGYYKIIIRYRRDVNSKMRILYDNKIYNIKRVINHLEENKYLILIVEEGDLI